MSPVYTVISEDSFASVTATSPDIAPLHSPSPNQNPFPASDMGLTFFGILFLVGIFLAGLLMLVTKYMGKRNARKAVEKMQKDEEAQAQICEVKADDTSSIVSEKTVVGTLTTDNKEKQLIVGEEDITNVRLDDDDKVENEDLGEPAAFCNAKCPGIIGESTTNSTNFPVVDGVRSASLLFVEATTETASVDNASDTSIISGSCSQPPQATSEDPEEDITEAFGRLFLSSGESIESLPQEDDNVSSGPVNDAGTETISGNHITVIAKISKISKSENQIPTPISRNRVSLNTPKIIKGTPHVSSYAHCFTMPPPTSISVNIKNTLIVDTIHLCPIHKHTVKSKLPNPPTRPSRDNTPPLYEDESIISENDCFLLPEIKLNPNPPQKYAADFEAYCRGRNSRTTTARTQDCTSKQEDLGRKSESPTAVSVSVPSPTPIVTIDAPCSDDQTNPVILFDPTSQPTPRTSSESTSTASPRAAKATHLAVPKMSLRTGRMVAQPKTDVKKSSTTMTKRRNRSTTIVGPRDTVGKVELKKSGGRVVSAAGGSVLARQTHLQQSSTGGVKPNPSPPKRSPASLPSILECAEAETTGAKVTIPASPTNPRPLKTRNTNTSVSVLRASLVLKDSADPSLGKDSNVCSRNSQENASHLTTIHLGATSRRNSRSLTYATQSLKGSFAGSSVNGLLRESYTPRTVGAQRSQTSFKRSSVSSWH